MSRGWAVMDVTLFVIKLALAVYSQKIRLSAIRTLFGAEFASKVFASDIYTHEERSQQWKRRVR
jgi:hypothetical protein